MGFEKFKRPLLMAQGFETTASSTVNDSLTVSGVFTPSGGVTLTAGITAGTGGYLASKVQTLTGTASVSNSSTGGTAILGYGVTNITVASATESTAANFIFKLNPPIAAGVFKRIYLTGTSATTKTLSVRTATSTHTFFGSTKNAVAFTTTVNNLGHGFAILLDGISTSQWALCGLPGVLSTAAALAGATA